MNLASRLGPASCVVGASFASVLLLAACSSADLPTRSSSGTPIEHRYQKGPLTLTVKASSNRITTTGELTLTLLTRSESGWAVTFPTVGSRLGNFTVIDRRSLGARLAGDNSTEDQESYRLASPWPGAQTVPSMRVTAHNESSTVTLNSTPLHVSVVAPISKGTRFPLNLKAFEGPIFSASLLPEVFAGATTVLAAFAATLLMVIGRMRRRREKTVQAIPPWVRARRALDRLVQLNLPGSGRHREFYEGISLLVRRYIEEMFDVNAGEQTTEEFLFSVRDSSALGGHRRFLGEFLAHCDLVKFAAYLPAQDEVLGAVRSCREFIDSTSRESSDR